MRGLSFRLLAFNVLLIFLPVGSMLYLNTFEKQLLEQQERAMVQEGRLLAAALSGAGIYITAGDTIADTSGGDLETKALFILKNLDDRVESRLRVVDGKGQLIADSAVLGHRTPVLTESPKLSIRGSLPEAYASEAERSVREVPLYQIVVPPLRRLIDIFSPPEVPIASAEFYSGKSLLDGSEIRAALEGRYGAATRISTGGQRSVTLYSALPIVGGAATEGGDENGTIGAVLVSRSTYRILGNLYRLRLDIITIFLYSLAFAVVLSLLLSLTITRPLRKLRDRAETLLLPESNLHEAVRAGFPALRHHDEIGDLSRSLRALWGRLADRVDVIDDFTSDTLHEIKNPLAAIRSSAEVTATELEELLEAPLRLHPADESRDRQSLEDMKSFLERILKETGRIDRLLGELREITRIDTHLAWEETEVIPVVGFIRELCAFYQPRAEERGILVRFEAGAARENEVSGSAKAARAAGESVKPTGEGVKPAAKSVRAAGEKDFFLKMNKDRFRQVLTNLMENGLDFARSELFVSVAQADSAPGYMEIMVGDDGRGIGERDRERIFNRFFSNRKERGDHAGLGLAICRSIVEGYGGRITAENRENGGALFRVQLPREGM